MHEEAVEAEFGLTQPFPLLVYFKERVPIIYNSSIREEKEICSWALENDEDVFTTIEVDSKILENMIEKGEELLVVFYDSEKKKQETLIQGDS